MPCIDVKTLPHYNYIAYQNAALKGIFEHDGYGAAVANIGQIYKPPPNEDCIIFALRLTF
jgi:hypothetical protein